MNNQEILDQIAKFEKGLSNPNIPESTKSTIKSKIEGLKSQLEKVEEKVEKKEEKLEAEEKKIQSELEDNIAKWEKGLSNPNIPASAKEAIKKKIAAAKEEVAKQKAEIKEDKKESEAEKKEVKAAVKKLAEVAKKAGKVKTKRKAVPKPEIKEEEREKKSEKRQSKLKGMMAELETLINKNKYLKAKYEGKGVDLERDASRPAKPFGYRFTGKDNYGVPTKEQIKKGMKDGSVDYEGRPNRSDKGPKKKYKLKDGGSVDNENAEMVLSKAKELEHHADELKNVVKPNSKVEAWEVAKMERAATDASDVTHYEDGKKTYMAKGGMSQGYDDREDERLGMKYGKMAGKDLKSTRARRDDARFEERMAKGGEVKYKIMQDVSDLDDPSGAYLVVDTTNEKILAEFDFKKEAQEYLKELKTKKMAKGGKLSSKAKYIPKRDIEEVEVDQNGKEKMIDGADLLDGIYVKKKALAKKAPAKKKPTKKASGGEVKPKHNRGGNVGQIVKLAKEIRKDDEKWTDAVKRASAQLKK